jgi:hypothetical protein
MDTTNNTYFQQPVNQTMWGPNPNPAYNMGGNPLMFNYQAPQPTNVSTLSEEEIKLISQKKPNKIDINIPQEDLIRSMCNHKHNGQDMPQQLNDGSGRVYCPICGAIWYPDVAEKEQLQDAVNLIYDQMQNAKWIGDYNIELVRDYFPIIELLKKFPDLFEYAMQTHNKYVNAQNYQTANDANAFNMFNSLMYGTPTAANMPYGQQPYQYGQQPQYNSQYMAQAQQPYQYGQQYNQAQGYQQGAPAPVMQNPMQATVPMNTQFTDQANMMMQGQYYGAPAQPQQQMGYAPQPQVQPQQPAQSAPTATTTPATKTESGDAQSTSTVALK